MHSLMTLGLVVILAAPQQQGGPPPIDQGKIDAAIRKGVEFLKTQVPALKAMKHVDRNMQEDELVLWTFVHADVAESDAAFSDLFKKMMERQLEATYCVALQAMILEELNRVKYQQRIKMCAQFLVDNQCGNGQW